MADNEKQWFESDNKPKGKPQSKPQSKHSNKRKPVNNKKNPHPHNPNVERKDMPQRPMGKNAKEQRMASSHNGEKKGAVPNKKYANKPVDAKKHEAPKAAPKTSENNRPVNKQAPKKQFDKKHNKKKIAPKKPEKKPEVIEQTTGFNKTKADIERKKRSKNTALKRAFVAASVCLAAVAVLVFIIHYLFGYIAAKPELTFISNGSVEHTIGARALIVRNETVIYSEASGDLITKATEGSRVYANQSIAMVVPADMQTVVDSLRNTQSQISQVQQELIQSGLADGADAIYDNFNDSLDPIIDMIRLDSMDGKVSGMSSYSSSVSVLLSQRETALAGLDFDDERLRVLRSDEEAYENQLAKNATNVTAMSPGVVSFCLDGLENVLNYNVLMESDVNTVFDYISGATGVIETNLVVSAGDGVARIASNEKQYFACFLDEKTATAEAFAVGTRHTINIGSEGISIGKCLVERVEPTSHGLYVVFSSTRYVEDLLDLRSVDIEVVINETEGLRVPIASLVNADYDRNIATIYVNNQGFCDEVSVIIEDYDREFAIIAPIGDNSSPNLHTVIITNPSSIKPGEKVDK